MRLKAPQVLEKVHHERGGDYRGDEVDERYNKQSGNHHATEIDAPGKALTRRPGRHSVEPSQRNHLEILATEKISVQPEENKKIYPGQQQVNRQRKQINK